MMMVLLRESMKLSSISNLWLDWYLQTTGQRLVGGAGGVDATSGASDSGHGGGS